MEQAGQIDLLILLFAFFSILIGFSRGFSVEMARLFVYVFSGVFGYYLIPVFQPVISSFIPHEKTARLMSLALGSLIMWFVLRIFSSSLIQNIKSSSFRRLDRSLGAVFGLGRSVVFLLLISFFVSAVSPSVFEKSQLLRLSFTGLEALFKKYPELNIFPQNPEQEPLPSDAEKMQADHVLQNEREQESDWKKSVKDYVLNANFQTKSGEKSLISFASELIAESMSAESGRSIPTELVEMMLREQLGDAAYDKKIQEMTPEQKMQFLQKLQGKQQETE